MVLATGGIKALLPRLQCPRCTSGVRPSGDQLFCTKPECVYSTDGFPMSMGQHVLVDFESSIFNRSVYSTESGTVVPRERLPSMKTRFKRLLGGKNKAAEAAASKMIRLLLESTRRPKILVIGGGTIGSGALELYENESIDLVSMDVYASANTHLVADAHRQPFADESFDGVWIQAVLEHVLSPEIVVAEIERLLRHQGLIYADTPFMQPVHEGPYDFTRFSLSGHRWLLRNFQELEAGRAGGAGTALASSTRYFFRAISGSDKLATLLAFPFFWLRFFDNVGPRRAQIDAASGTFFLGRKLGTSLTPLDIVSYYQKQTIS